jgi:hypothetical protein
MPTRTAGEQGCSIIHPITIAVMEAQEQTATPAASSEMFSITITVLPIQEAPAVLLPLLPVPAVLPAHQEVAAVHR